MKLKYLALITLLAFAGISTANACSGANCSKTNPYSNSRNNSSGYQSSSGTQYDYDLSNPVDRTRYSIDLEAQQRDSTQGSISTSRSMDQLKGEYGGGYRGNDNSSGSKR
ncbi:MAG: hypothetical protein Q4G44_05980 [Alcaligenaceae bacterium]|nr:hypothetical protein [Alcaligenaceae bacterium]